MPAPTTPTALPPGNAAGESPLLQSFMEVLERESGLHMSFDDLTGFRSGFHEDVELLNLDWRHQLHACDFCEFAKVQDFGMQDCVKNKLAANRVVVSRQRGIEGYCRLGLFDLAEPLIHQDRMLGIFYYGSVLVRERLDISRAKILRQCQRRQQDPQPYFDALAAITVIDEASIPRHRQALQAVARLAKYLCESTGVQLELYRSRKLTYPYVDPDRYPHVVRATILYINTHLDQPFIVKDIANHIGCHPDFLSRRFKQYTRMDLSTYLNQARVEHAKHLLQNSKIDIGTASELSGFSNRVHFSKVFKRVTGLTPGAYQQQVR